jgi:hypothetical protein
LILIIEKADPDNTRFYEGEAIGLLGPNHFEPAPIAWRRKKGR